MQAEGNEQRQVEKHLGEAREIIRGLALKRKLTTTDGEVSGAKKPCHRECSVDCKEAKRNPEDNLHSDDELSTMFIGQGKELRALEEHRIVFEEERFEVKSTPAEREVQQQEVLLPDTSRRFDLDERKFVLNREERKQAVVKREQALQERRKITHIMELLAKKLQGSTMFFILKNDIAFLLFYFFHVYVLFEARGMAIKEL